MSVFYNDNDKHCCRWLTNLTAAGHLPAGTIDSRSITDLTGPDLAPYTQCHFFAGIGGWPLALQLAGVPDLECWTGSPPCQPFSCAGKRKGIADKRHLWPEFYRLIQECVPPVVFGEQTPEAATSGWLDRVCNDLEASGYACGSAILPACSVGSPQIRSRLFWVAYRSGLQAGQQKPQNSLCRTHPSWSDGVPLSGGCCDRHGKRTRRCPPGVPLLADGVSEIMVATCGFGNSIVPQVAATFISAFMEIL